MSDQEERHSIKLEDKNSIKLEEDNDAKQDQEMEEDPDDYDQANSGLNQDGGSVPEGGTQLIKKRTHRKLDISNFIMKTYKILEDKRNSSIVEWTDEGNCFIVKDKEKFSREILPKYFKHSKFSSFVRQLNMYDFHKIRKEKEIPIFKHKYFKENCMDQLHKIKRKNGEEGREDDGISKELINFSEPLIRLDNTSRQLISIKSKTSTLLTAQSEIQLLRRENMELKHSINDIDQEIQLLELSKEKKREKLMKIISSLMFFDLNNDGQTGTLTNLRQLQEHFLREDDPLSFSEYRHSLATIYSGLKAKLIQ